MQLTFAQALSAALLLVPTTIATPAPLTPEAGNATEALTLAAGGKAQYCRYGLRYCGWNLIEKHLEDYKTRISNKLCQRGICDPWDGAIWNSLWYCGADLEFQAICGGTDSCVDGGTGAHDYCKA